MKLTDWHRRYLFQAGWTRNLRGFLLNKLGVQSGSRILEVGSGTGALMPDFQALHTQPCAVDIELSRSLFAKKILPDLSSICADGRHLPVCAGAFDFAVCHYLLLWSDDPLSILKEMARVTHRGGAVIAFAEPDYASRVDYPQVFSYIGNYQNRSLEFQGVDIMMGRKLGLLFRQSGLEDVKSGLLGGEWRNPEEAEFDAEWDVIAWDLGGFVPVDEILSLREKAKESWLSGEATVFIPTFYAYGIVT